MPGESLELVPLAQLVRHHGEAQWAFIATLPEPALSQYPVLEVAGDIYLSLECCPVARWGLPSSEIAARIDDFLSKEVADAGGSKTLRSPLLRVMQVNPCTLRDTTRLRNFLGQCRKMQVHIVFAQEHMRRWGGIFEEAGYTLAQSSADAGVHGGCLVAVSQVLFFAESWRLAYQGCTRGRESYPLQSQMHDRLYSCTAGANALPIHTWLGQGLRRGGGFHFLEKMVMILLLVTGRTIALFAESMATAGLVSVLVPQTPL